MLELRCREQQLWSLNLHIGNYTRPLFEVPYVYTAEVIPYQEKWKRSLQ